MARPNICINKDSDRLRSELRRAGLFLPVNDMPITGWLFVNSDNSVGTRPLVRQADYTRIVDEEAFVKAAQGVVL